MNLLIILKKNIKKAVMQGKDINKLKQIIEELACGHSLERKYKDHKLYSNKKFNNCRECHIEPDWLLVYRVEKKELILILVEIGTHGYLFNK